MSVSAALGDRRSTLEAVAARLAAQIDVCESSRDLAPLAGRLQSVVAELEQLDSGREESKVDDLASRRAARRSASQGR